MKLCSRKYTANASASEFTCGVSSLCWQEGEKSKVKELEKQLEELNREYDQQASQVRLMVANDTLYE